MSFILDALKKSESDRQRQAHPETAYVPAASEDRRPSRWIWVVGILLSANMIALAYVLMRPEVPPQPAAATVPAQERDTSVVEMTPESAPARTVDDADISPPNSVRQQARPVPATPPSESLALASEPAELPAELPTDNAADAADAAASPEFMTFSEARVAGMQVNDLLLELHVFSSAPAERFVFINMGKYREGETLSEGPRVREIRPDGVLLEYSDMLFLLARE